MGELVVLPNGQVLEMPDLPVHQHEGTCSCIPAVGYIRVSDVHGRGPDQFVSPDVQLLSIDQWCQSFGRRLVALIFDIDKTGQTFEGRLESVGEILDGCKTGRWKTVAMWKWSRWSRDTAEALAWIEKVEKAGGEVRACSEDMDPKQTKAKFMRGFHLLLAEERGREIGEGWQAAHQNRRDQGMPHSGRPRFGYEYRSPTEEDRQRWPDRVTEKDVVLGKRRYIPNTNMGAVLAAGYQAYIDGQSLRSLAMEWNQKGIRTTGEKRWTPQSLGKMLDTGFAAGFIRHRINPPKKAPANRLSSYDGWAVGRHPRLITIEQWEHYRARRDSQAELPPRSRSAVHSVSAMLFCGLCGCRQSTKYQGRNRTHQWTCQSRAAKHPDTHVGISNEMILQHLRDWLVGRVPNDFASRVRQEAERLAAKQVNVADADRIRLELEQITKKEIPNLIRLQMRGAISDDQFDMMKLEAEGRSKNLRAELKATEAAQSFSEGHLDLVIDDISSNWDTYRENPAGHRELLSTVIAGVVIFPGRGKLSLDSRVQVFAAWESGALKAFIEARRADS